MKTQSNIEQCNFGTYLKKWGNSFSIRIPKILIDKLNLIEDEKVKVSISRPERLPLSEKQINNTIKKLKKINAFNRYNEIEIRIFLYAMDSIIWQRILKKKNENGISKKEITKSFGTKFIKGYLEFVRLLENNQLKADGFFSIIEQ